MEKRKVTSTRKAKPQEVAKLRDYEFWPGEGIRAQWTVVHATLRHGGMWRRESMLIVPIDKRLQRITDEAICFHVGMWGVRNDNSRFPLSVRVHYPGLSDRPDDVLSLPEGTSRMPLRPLQVDLRSFTAPASLKTQMRLNCMVHCGPRTAARAPYRRGFFFAAGQLCAPLWRHWRDSRSQEPFPYPKSIRLRSAGDTPEEVLYAE